ncbi:MAG: HAD hydrolase family protein, partial [Blautia wexlerae]
YISDDYMEKSVQARMKYAFGNNKSAVNAPINPAFRKMTSKYRDDVNKTAFVLNSYQDYLDAVKEFKDMVVGTWGGKGQLALYGDTSPEGISKEFAINKLLDYLHIDKKESICFGDSSSDLPMFNACNIKIAMKNGNDEIKQKATYIADDVDDNGVYKMFKQLQII